MPCSLWNVPLTEWPRQVFSFLFIHLFAGSMPPLPPSMYSISLLIHQCGGHPATPRPCIGPWKTSFTLQGLIQMLGKFMELLAAVLHKYYLISPYEFLNMFHTFHKYILVWKPIIMQLFLMVTQNWMVWPNFLVIFPAVLMYICYLLVFISHRLFITAWKKVLLYPW